VHEKTLILTETPPALLERLEPRVKLICVAVWALCIVTAPPQRWPLLVANVAILALLLATNRRLIGRFVRRLLPALPAILGICLFLPFLQPGEAVWEMGFLTITRPGVETAARVGSVAALCVAAVALLWAGTRRDQLLVGLRGVGLPTIFVGMLAFMLRYLDVLRPELHRLTDARAARTIGPRGPGRLGSGAHIIGALFLRAHDRAEQVADAMAARGYTGELRGLYTPHFHRRDILAGVVFCGLVLASRVLLGA
jgi:cobalt/nickel transport system permease protein